MSKEYYELVIFCNNLKIEHYQGSMEKIKDKLIEYNINHYGNESDWISKITGDYKNIENYCTRLQFIFKIYKNHELICHQPCLKLWPNNPLLLRFLNYLPHIGNMVYQCYDISLVKIEKSQPYIIADLAYAGKGKIQPSYFLFMQENDPGKVMQMINELKGEGKCLDIM